jgi:two-component system LytT family sensor kinase
MKLRPSRRGILLVAGALLACAVLALRDTASSAVGATLDPRIRELDDIRDYAAWMVLYCMMWAALTPLVFFLADRVRFRPDRWFGPLAFHAGAGLVMATVAPTCLAVLFGGVVLRRGWPHAADLLSPFWTHYAAYRAIADTWLYWLILAAGIAIRVYDEAVTRRLLAADLERSLATAQLDVLKMKLQPHFLFNTLNSIRFLALERDGQAVVTLVEKLGNLLRASMQAGSTPLVPLEQELALLDEYLAIEEVRFGDRLRIARRVDPDASRCRLPSLVLQPIVENSIKHGFSRRLGATHLEIVASREADSLHVVVRDDGPGLPAGWDLATDCGRGLKNVIERLDALYRGKWSLTVRNAETAGTIVDLRIPYSERAEPAPTRPLGGPVAEAGA